MSSSRSVKPHQSAATDPPIIPPRVRSTMTGSFYLSPFRIRRPCPERESPMCTSISRVPVQRGLPLASRGDPNVFSLRVLGRQPDGDPISIRHFCRRNHDGLCVDSPRAGSPDRPFRHLPRPREDSRSRQSARHSAEHPGQHLQSAMEHQDHSAPV